MDKFYIRFHDNDFCTTVKAFVEAIAPRILLGEWGGVTKEQLVSLFNDHSFSMYALHQCHSTTPNASLRSYLKLRPQDVYFDAEVDGVTDFNGDGCVAFMGHDKINYCVM